LKNAGTDFTRLSLALGLLVALVSQATAESPADTATRWGLIGPWSLDCALPADRGIGTVLSYEIVGGDRLIHRRNFGDGSDESEVVGATISADGVLNLRIYFPAFKETRELGLMKLSDDSMRAVYNRSENGRYSIKGGKFTATGKPTPVQHKCR
jgi:hypothetical protein